MSAADHILAAVADDSDVVVTATGKITHLCPHVGEVDHGTVTVTWRVEGRTFELHALAAYFGQFKDAALSHEQITDRIAHDLAQFEDITVISVGSEWHTAGLTVTCHSTPPKRTANSVEAWQRSGM